MFQKPKKKRLKCVMRAEFDSVRLLLSTVKAYFHFHELISIKRGVKHEPHGFTPIPLCTVENTLFDVERHQIRCCNSLNFQDICVEVSLKCS